MTKRIFRSIFFTSLAVVVTVSALVLFMLYRINEKDAVEKLKTEAAYIAGFISQEESVPAFFEKYYTADRITYMAKDGTVLYDNTTDASSMENHAGRQEVATALKNGAGESYRYSDTLYQKTFYYAIKTDGDNVLRVAKTRSSALGLLWAMLPVLSAIVLAIALLSFITARYMSRQITAPINALNLDSPFENDIYDELSSLLLRIDHQNKEIKSKMREITEKQREFNAVTENMQEGLILLSHKGSILSINASAAAIFDTDIKGNIGRHILSVNRSVSMQNVFKETIKGGNSQALLTIKNRHYQLLGNQVVTKDGSLGAVIVTFDVTEKQNAEHSRREFTANVSHELKTPLTSILGFAEIMKDGMTKPEDMRGFVGRIYSEAGRLLALIDDILELSQLDEQAKLPQKERIDLFALAEDVLNRLKPMAEKVGVNTSIKGEHIAVTGYRKILDEIAYNLCDNAIKYNVEGGSVDVTIDQKDGKPVVTVRDTGIGIPAGHQSHIFERFYRVDKSRSKEIGGTGLGLAIVKHGAMLHDIIIDMKSKENTGTTFVLTFPPNS